MASLALLGITILAGALVAGMDAGLLYNHYPLMGNGLVPVEYGEAGWLDPFENPASAQFHHRWIAAVTFGAVVVSGAKGATARLASAGQSGAWRDCGAIHPWHCHASSWRACCAWRHASSWCGGASWLFARPFAWRITSSPNPLIAQASPFS